MTASLKHTFREIETKNANDKISNETLKGGSTSQDVMQKYNDRLKEIIGDKKKPRKNAVLAIETIQTFSPEMVKNINIDQWKKDNLKFLEDTFGKDNVISAVLHLDEKTPHVTSIILPIDSKNRLNCFEVTSRKNLFKYQDSYAKSMEKHALRRGERGSKVKHTPPQKFYTEYNKMVGKIERDEEKIDELLSNKSIPKKKLTELNGSYNERVCEYIDDFKEPFERLVVNHNKLKLENKYLVERNESLYIRLNNKINELKSKDREIENLVETINTTPVLTDELSNELILLRKFKEDIEEKVKQQKIRKQEEQYRESMKRYAEEKAKEDTDEDSHSMRRR